MRGGLWGILYLTFSRSPTNNAPRTSPRTIFNYVIYGQLLHFFSQCQLLTNLQSIGIIPQDETIQQLNGDSEDVLTQPSVTSHIRSGSPILCMEKLSVSEADAANELGPIAMDPYRRLLFALRDGTYPMVNEADFTQAFGEDEEAKGTVSGSLHVTRRTVIFIFIKLSICPFSGPSINGLWPSAQKFLQCLEFIHNLLSP